MEDLYPLSRKLKICPYCAADRRDPEPSQPFERRRKNAPIDFPFDGVYPELSRGARDKAQGALPEFLAELRRNFRYDAPFEPIWAEAVAP